MSKKASHIFIIMLLSSQLFAQTPLNTKISIQAKDAYLENVLNEIEQKAKFQLSYSSAIIDLHQSKVSVNATNEKVSKVLYDIIPIEVELLERGTYVIIQDQNAIAKSKKRLKGRVYDSKSKKPLEGVTIYQVKSLEAGLSEGSGTYDFDYTQDQNNIHLAYSKANYKDTVVVVSKDFKGVLDIELQPIVDDQMFDQNQSAADSIALVKLLAGKKAIAHMQNVNLFYTKRAQFSFLPMLGTNRQFSGKIGNNLSLNLIAGYNHSLQGLELGGFANIIRKDMSGVQLAGFGNVVGNNSKGVQGAGFFNINKGVTKGVMLAGFFNTAIDTFIGFQASGFANVGPYTKGVQLSGFVNTTWAGSRANQYSGFVNYTKSNTGVQTTGFLNFSLKEHKGLQAAGFVNYSGGNKGVQIAGFSNINIGTLDGLQISGFLNYTKELKGLQIALVNIADTVSSGVNIGLLNLVRKGLFEIEIHYSDISEYNVLIKSGTDLFYNIFATTHFEEENLYTIGYGLGNRRTYPSGFTTGIEIQSHAVIEGDGTANDDLNLLNHLNLYFGYRFHKNILLTGGPVLSVYVSDYQNPIDQSYGYNILSKPFYNVTDKGRLVQASIGYRLGISF